MTVFPIVLNSGAPIPGVSPAMSKNIAEMVGLLLERGGMKPIEIAAAQFSPPKDADLAKLAVAFGRFVQSRNLKTDYALCGQFIGTPGKGADEIRLAVVDRQGKVVLADRLDRQQLMLKRMLERRKESGPPVGQLLPGRPAARALGIGQSKRKRRSRGQNGSTVEREVRASTQE